MKKTQPINTSEVREQVSMIERILHTLTGIPEDKSSTKYKTISVLYKNNPDGTVRWFWQAGLQQPLFLKMYYVSGKRSVIISRLIRMAFALKLQRFFASGKCRINLSETAFDHLNNMLGSHWAGFAGTRGTTQTAVFFAGNKFVKVPVGPDAAKMISDEYTQLTHLPIKETKNIQIPSVCIDGNVLITTDISEGNKRSDRFGDRHWEAVAELSGIHRTVGRIGDLPGWKEAGQIFQRLSLSSDRRIPRGLIRKLTILYNEVHENTLVSTSFSHGDLTPWNVFVRDKGLALIDWEFASDCRPLFYDVFLFHYQYASLIAGMPAAVLRQQLSKAFSHPISASIMQSGNADLSLHHTLYLLLASSSFMEKYSRQEKWHPQVEMSLRIWSEMADSLLTESGLMDMRSQLILSLLDLLRQSAFAAMKWGHGDPCSLPETSDLDLCMGRREANLVHSYLVRHPYVSSMRIQNSSCMKQFTVLLKDNSLFSLDAIWEFRRRHLTYLDTEQVLSNATVNQFGLPVPQALDDCRYVYFFYRLNGADIPVRYTHLFNSEEAKTNTLSILETELALVGQLPANKGWNAVKRKLLYAHDLLRDLIFHRGFMISFSGVDGAGKSTVIGHVKTEIEKKFRRKVVVLRHRPALLPMLSAWKEGREKAERMAAERMPRQGSNKNFLSSLLRFVYYLSDYLLGQFLIQVKYVWRGYIVIYDRYYFDFVHDTKRSNILLPAWFTRPWYGLLFKPAYNFFLFADPEIILARKRELDADTIRNLTGNYLTHFDHLSRRYSQSKYISINNERIEETLSTIRSYIKHKAI